MPSLVGADLVAGAADALHAGGDGGRRLDLDDQVDGAHVDAELEGGGGDEGADLPALRMVFDFGALRGGERAVMGAGEGLLAASSLRAPARRSAVRRLLTKMRVDWRARTMSRRRGGMVVQMEARLGPCEVGRWDA